jgi:hypothetical protein
LIRHRAATAFGLHPASFVLPSRFFWKSDNMKQNGAAFCRLRFAIYSEIPLPTRSENELKGPIMSPSPVF